MTPLEISNGLLTNFDGTVDLLDPEVRDSVRLVTHTLQVERQFDLARTLLTDAETGQRGFLLTGDESYLQPNIDAVTALRLVWLAVGHADLYPDEAQYWWWSTHPALGYYSKPPMVAWLIAVTTAAFGDSESEFG